MKIDYLRTAKKSFMIVKDADYTYEHYELQMILKNDIASLLTFQIMVGDGAVEYWYDVTGMQSLDRQFSVRPVDEAEIRRLLGGLIDMKYDMDRYLLDDRNIVFLTDMIFYDRFLDKLRFCYIPGLSGQKGYEIRKLFEELLQHLDHRDPLAVSIGYDLYERCMAGEFALEDCRECLCRHSREQRLEEEQETDWKEDDRKEDEQDEKTEEEADKRVPERKWFHRKAKRQNKKQRRIHYSRFLDEEQEISSTAEEIHAPEQEYESKGYTQFFAPEELMDIWELIYKGDGMEKDLVLTEFPYYIGTDSTKVQGVMQSRCVSRIHARLFLEENRLMLEDYNSTNGTWLNRHLLPMNTPSEVHPGDRIVIATEEYMVHCRKRPK